MDVKGTVEGWRNKLLPPKELKELIETVRTQRLDICSKCQWHSSNRKRDTDWSSVRLDEFCTKCGCTLSAKCSCLSCECPLKKWLAVTTQEEFEQINKEVNEKSENQESTRRESDEQLT